MTVLHQSTESANVTEITGKIAVIAEQIDANKLPADPTMLPPMVSSP